MRSPLVADLFSFEVINTFIPSAPKAPDVAFPITADDFLDNTIDFNKHIVNEKQILFTEMKKNSDKLKVKY